MVLGPRGERAVPLVVGQQPASFVAATCHHQGAGPEPALDIGACCGPRCGSPRQVIDLGGERDREVVGGQQIGDRSVEKDEATIHRRDPRDARRARVRMVSEPLPWTVVETLPSSDETLVAHWEEQVSRADGDAERAHALVGRALTSYWAVQERVSERTWAAEAERRGADVDEALRLARAVGDPTLITECLLGGLYARWGPGHPDDRAPVLAELAERRGEVEDRELRLRGREQVVVAHLDRSDLDAAAAEVRHYLDDARPDHPLARRRAELWRANLAMLEGRIDDAVAANQQAVSSTADTAGSPFSFQNVAITLAIERYLRRGLDDLIDAIRSIRASSDRVGANWTTGLAFSLSETGHLDEARALFEEVAADGFARVLPDLNWLVTVQLLGLIALNLDDRPCVDELATMLGPYADLDATHGAGYASYGPVGRVVGSLLARTGRLDEGLACLDRVLTTRAPGPWRSLTLLDRARAARHHDPLAAETDAAAAEAELRSFGLEAWADQARALRDELDLAGHGAPIAYRKATTWTLRHPAGTATVADSVGMAYLTELLAHPGRPRAVTDLDTEVDRDLPTEATTMASLDAAARTAYRRRLDHLDRLGRPLSTDEDAEAQLLRRELAGGAYHRSTSAELERARVRVTKAIRRAIDAVGASSPALDAHLADAVDTGRRCLYAPADGQAWRVVSAPDGT